MVFLFAGPLFEGGKRWLSILIVGLIILASSLLGKMFQDWRRDVKKRDEKENK
jgi:hypothetical protein